ncbi:hypothetical protein OIU77_028512 [Salix suchowensis]|uniref:Cytochrome P450 n=1 Tax=Salix suchowensis TaxID=1278906 RepID=A0ABQ9BHT9_9ROSI|nr:hypothetical protein OIU77_028512 [Salix suchowensis]
MGWPLIGESLQFIAPGRSLDLHPFIKKRMQKVHRYIRSITLNHFGVESLKESLLPKIEEMLHTNLSKWATQGPVDIKHVISVEEYASITCLSIDPGPREDVENFKGHTDGETPRSTSKRRGDFLDQAIDDMETEKFLTVDSITQLLFGILFANFESMSTILTLNIQAEHDAIVRKRENPNSRLTWEEYKSMTFTQMVVNESLRISNNVPGYTVPAGWAILLVTPAAQLNPETFKDPTTFNPWRWKHILFDSYRTFDQVTISKNFMPFGGGTRQCAGAEYSKLVLSTFLHILVTRFRFTKVKGGDVSRTPIISFGDGIQIKFTAKN